MKSLSLVYTYYNQLKMLQKQLEVWASYPDDIKEKIEIIVVDDGSKDHSAKEIDIPAEVGKFSLYRIKKDIPWNQDGARNLGAHVARHDWLFLCDLDHVLPLKALRKLLEKHRQDRYYAFRRVRCPHMRPTLTIYDEEKHGLNIFAVSRSLYWLCGGYDETYRGLYGPTDIMFLNKLDALATKKTIKSPLVLFMDTSIEGVKTPDLTRDGHKEVIEKFKKIKYSDPHSIKTLDFKWKLEFQQ